MWNVLPIIFYLIVVLSFLVCVTPATTTKSHYATLGIFKDADLTAIKTAYRKLAMKVQHVVAVAAMITSLSVLILSSFL